jgi:hypothetical protein
MAGEVANADKTPAYGRHITEQTIATAAGLMKDWTTALIQLQTGVFGALVGYADFSKLYRYSYLSIEQPNSGTICSRSSDSRSAPEERS